MNIQEPSPRTQPAPLWRLAFRAGFLLAAAFAVASMGRWLLWLHNPTAWSGALSPHWWHAHEMIFGFAMPVVAGFLLTAVATWTGLPGTRGTPLQVLFGLWLLARTVLWLAPHYSWLAWCAEIAFIAITAIELTRRVWARLQWRNMVFLPVLLALCLLSSASYWLAQDTLASTRLHYGALWMITVLVVIIGGRVTPLFTANRLGLTIAPHPVWFDYIAWLLIALIGVLVALGIGANSMWLAGLCLVSAAIHLYRMWRWQSWKTLGVPLLWSMHLSYLCIPLALIALAATHANPFATKHVMHLLAVGTIGGMILAMMSRVSLGHTGRPLEIPRFISLAFVLIPAAALLRVLIPVFAPSQTLLAWQGSAALWCVAFTLFLWHYVPILTRERADGKPG